MPETQTKTTAAVEKLPHMHPVLVLHFASGTRIEIYALDPGEVFQHFGGSRHGLVVRKTSSLITRTVQHGCSDVERSVGSNDFWRWMARLTRRKDIVIENITTPRADAEEPADPEDTEG